MQDRSRLIMAQKANASWYERVAVRDRPEGRYLSLVHPRELQDDIRVALQWVAHTYGRAHEFYRQGNLTKIAVIAYDRPYTLEFDQAPIRSFLASTPELAWHGDFVTTIKLPRSGHGRSIACAAGALALLDDKIALAFTHNAPWPGARIRYMPMHWRGRTYNAIRYSDRSHSIQYLNIPKSICAQIINAYDRRSFVEAAIAREWLIRYKAILISRERFGDIDHQR